MLSLISCKSGERERCCSDDLSRIHENKVRSSLCNNLEPTIKASNQKNSLPLACLLSVCLLLIGCYIESVESAEAVQPWLSSGCHCKGRIIDRDCCLPYYGKARRGLDSETFRDLDWHQDHPDHVPDGSSKLEPLNLDSILDVDGESRSIGAGSNHELTDDGEKVIRHRKVYVSEKPRAQDPIIHPISLTIPIEVRDEPLPALPPPKPLFRMHKYTTYETQPEIQMVPVTTTVIKPVGVSQDQFIDDKKKL